MKSSSILSPSRLAFRWRFWGYPFSYTTTRVGYVGMLHILRGVRWIIPVPEVDKRVRFDGFTTALFGVPSCSSPLVWSWSTFKSEIRRKRHHSFAMLVLLVNNQMVLWQELSDDFPDGYRLLPALSRLHNNGHENEWPSPKRWRLKHSSTLVLCIWHGVSPRYVATRRVSYIMTYHNCLIAPLTNFSVLINSWHEFSKQPETKRTFRY